IRFHHCTSCSARRLSQVANSKVTTTRRCFITSSPSASLPAPHSTPAPPSAETASARRWLLGTTNHATPRGTLPAPSQYPLTAGEAPSAQPAESDDTSRRIHLPLLAGGKSE